MSKHDPLIWGWLDEMKRSGVTKGEQYHACNCVGPRPGQPVCPCRMGSLKVVDGRYVEIIDHGPATARSKV